MHAHLCVCAEVVHFLCLSHRVVGEIYLDHMCLSLSPFSVRHVRSALWDRGWCYPPVRET